MQVTLTKKQFDYLELHLDKDRPDLAKQLRASGTGKKIVVELSEEAASDVRDWASEQLQKRGFNENYDVNEEGQLLEDLIDVLYV